MSITDELRKWLKSLYTPNSATVKDEGEHIADRIDAEYQKAIRELNNLADASVLLPVDADGVPIRVGDVMDSKVDYLFDGKPFTVRALVLCEDGWEVGDGRFGNRYEPDSLRHHHEPTVEDVLREFALAVCKDDALTIRKGVVDEYAAKLQLREDA